MIRRAFTMRLKPGAMAEYKRHHDQIWPELVAEIERQGIASISTFERDPDLFLFSEIRDPEAWNRLWSSDIHRRWGEVMGYADADFQELLATFTFRRAELVRVLRRLTPGDWQRVGLHEARGPITLRDTLHHIVEHEAEHCLQLEDLLSPA